MPHEIKNKLLTEKDVGKITVRMLSEWSRWSRCLMTGQQLMLPNVS